MEILPRCHRKNGVCIVVKSDDESYKLDEKNGSSILCNTTHYNVQHSRSAPLATDLNYKIKFSMILGND